MTRDTYVIIPHPTEPKVLVAQTAGGWSLPCTTVPDKMLAMVEPLIEAVRQQFVIEVTVLRRARVYQTTNTDGAVQSVGIFELENHSTTVAPPVATRWIGGSELSALLIPDDIHRETIAAWGTDEAGTVPPLRAPWAQKGWWDRTTDWIRTQLATLGYSVSGSMTQLKQWSISAVVRVPTHKGVVFFKALPPFFAIEPVVTRALARWYPDYLPQVLVIDPSQRWMVQHAFTGVGLEVSGRAAWDRALRELAQMQIEYRLRVPELLALGCADRRLTVLEQQIEPLLYDPPLQELAGLDEAEIKRLRTLAPHLKALCKAVAACGIPGTLAHGDFHSGNVTVSGNHCIIYDWSDACVGHPFFDLHTVFLSNFPETLQEERDQLRDTYLQAWTSFAPKERLLYAFEQSKPLNALHQAVSYRHILEGLEPDTRDELRGGLTYWLRMVLELK
jgi:hypothetical protein